MTLLTWILLRRARWLLPCLEVIWGLITFAQSRATNVTQLYVARFFIGALEAPVFAGTHFILGEFRISYQVFGFVLWNMS